MANRPTKSFLDHIREWLWVPVVAPITIVLANQYLRSLPPFSLPEAPKPPVVAKPSEPKQPNPASAPISPLVPNCQKQEVAETNEQISIQGEQVNVNLALMPQQGRIATIECQLPQPGTSQFELEFGTADPLAESTTLEIWLDDQQVLKRSLAAGVRDRFSQTINQKFTIQAYCPGDECAKVYIFRLVPLNSL
ncbi:MAG: hypothetical protein SFT94_12805 [Pseudanabaenaceae cyanobacterium bins.68]|nr:hypothetical protein [Pseudanabaenaceae cyanobacterium bins.68]